MALTSAQIKTQALAICGGNLATDTARATAMTNAVNQGYIEARILATPLLVGNAHPAWFNVLVEKCCLWRCVLVANPEARELWEPLRQDYWTFIKVLFSKAGRRMDSTQTITAWPEEA